MRKIGAHVSAAGGFDKAVERAAKIGANCVQIFSGSPRVWKRSKLEEVDTDALFAAQKAHNITPIFTHALYLVNLASDKKELQDKSVNALIYDLSFDAKIEGSGVVVHLGSHQGRGWEVARDQVVANIAQILEKTPKNSTFLIENSAGQKGKLTSDLADIRWLMDQLNDERVGCCIDTCHSFAAGIQLSALADEITKNDLWASLKVIHVNDSRDTFDSGRDRHANIGDGSIPRDQLKSFLNHEKVKEIPLILEVPGLDGNGPDAENIKRLKDIVS